MPLKIRRSRQARIDQDDIWLYLAEHSMRAADAVIDEIDDTILMLAGQPEAGRARNDLRRGIRYFPAGSYLIFYNVSPGHLDIRRVLHGARDIVADLFDEN